MKTKLINVFFALLLLFTLSCGKDTPTGDVALYLLDSYTTIGDHRQIDESTVVTKVVPLISYSDMLSYNSKEYTFTLTDAGVEAVRKQLSQASVPFAVKVGDKLIYTGYFQAGFSSFSYSGIKIQFHQVVGNQVTLSFEQRSGEQMPDKRNDKSIIRVFDRDDKLVKK